MLTDAKTQSEKKQLTHLIPNSLLAMEAALKSLNLLLECVVFSVWIKVRVKAGGRPGAWELSNTSSVTASVSAAFNRNTFTYSTQLPVKESRCQGPFSLNVA